MANAPTVETSFRVAQIQAAMSLVWTKPDSSWAWTLAVLPGGRTRLVTRLRQRYRPTPAALITVLLAEFGDFPMMGKMLHGIKRRAEYAYAASGAEPDQAPVGRDVRPWAAGTGSRVLVEAEEAVCAGTYFSGSGDERPAGVVVC